MTNEYKNETKENLLIERTGKAVSQERLPPIIQMESQERIQEGLRMRVGVEIRVYFATGRSYKKAVHILGYETKVYLKRYFHKTYCIPFDSANNRRSHPPLQARSDESSTAIDRDHDRYTALSLHHKHVHVRRQRGKRNKRHEERGGIIVDRYK